MVCGIKWWNDFIRWYWDIKFYNTKYIFNYYVLCRGKKYNYRLCIFK